MAQKQRTPNQRLGHLDDKFRQNASNVAGKARRTLFTADNVSNGSTFGLTTIYSKTFSAKFLKSVGDSIFLTFFGRIVSAAGASAFTLLLQNESGATILSLFTPFAYGSANVQVWGDANFSLSEGRVLSAAGKLISNDATFPIVMDASGGSAVLNAKQITFSILANCSADVNGVDFDLIQAEFSPAVIT